jgi:hypothetical protein
MFSVLVAVPEDDPAAPVVAEPAADVAELLDEPAAVVLDVDLLELLHADASNAHAATPAAITCQFRSFMSFFPLQKEG